MCQTCICFFVCVVRWFILENWQAYCFHSRQFEVTYFKIIFYIKQSRCSKKTLKEMDSKMQNGFKAQNRQGLWLTLFNTAVQLHLNRVLIYRPKWKLLNGKWILIDFKLGLFSLVRLALSPPLLNYKWWLWLRLQNLRVTSAVPSAMWQDTLDKPELATHSNLDGNDAQNGLLLWRKMRAQQGMSLRHWIR
jgi:hypothetical protein